MATKKKTAKKTAGARYLVLENGERFLIEREDGRYFYCEGERQFGRNHPSLAGIEEDEKTEGE